MGRIEREVEKRSEHQDDRKVVIENFFFFFFFSLRVEMTPNDIERRWDHRDEIFRFWRVIRFFQGLEGVCQIGAFTVKCLGRLNGIHRATLRFFLFWFKIISVLDFGRRLSRHHHVKLKSPRPASQDGG